MAVFLALSVGIAVGVTLRPSVDEGLAAQAAQDRKQVQDLRAELDRRDALDEYREAYASGSARSSPTGDARRHPGRRGRHARRADARWSQSISTAVDDGGRDAVQNGEDQHGRSSTRTRRRTRTPPSPVRGALGLTDSMSAATKVGLALGRSIAAADAWLARRPGGSDRRGADSAPAWSTISERRPPHGAAASSSWVAVATRSAPTPAVQLSAHVEIDVALRGAAVGRGAGRTQQRGIEGTDVLQSLRADATAVDLLSTVDVADLQSGVTTTVLAGQEQMLGGGGRHYGALAKADAPLPTCRFDDRRWLDGPVTGRPRRVRPAGRRRGPARAPTPGCTARVPEASRW